MNEKRLEEVVSKVVKEVLGEGMSVQEWINGYPGSFLLDLAQKVEEVADTEDLRLVSQILRELSEFAS